MKTRYQIVTLLSVVLLLVTICSGQTLIPPQETGASPTAKGELHTTLRLLANTKSVQPGSSFTVGLLMTMQKGWHTYWKNSGEAGLPTQIHWSLPKGVTAGDISWPLPHKYDESGEVLTYGYETENMLLVDISTPKTLRPGSKLTLKANVNWLECEHLCIPGSGLVELILPVKTEGPERDNVTFFDRYSAQVPRQYSPSDAFALATELRDNAVEIRIRANGKNKLVVTKDATPDFYPEAIEEIVNGRTVVTANAGEATLRVPLSVSEKVQKAFTFRGVLIYQIESGERTAVELSVPLPVEFCATLPIVGENKEDSGSLLNQTFATTVGQGDEMPFSLYLAFAFIGGLLLNIMPCVLPVIALKIFGLVRMAGDQPRQVKRLGIFFSLGILASFLVLALLVILLKGAGEQVGWGFQFQEPLFVVAMSALIFAFGLSLFGVYEIGLPAVVAFAGVGGALEKRAKEGKGYTASFAEGVFATILATPCTAPFLGTALGFAFAQRAWVTLVIFTTVAIGMALPYVVLTAKPAWMKFLPKPGEWMVTAKQFMGFLLMATMLWLLYVLGKQLGMEAVIWTGAFLLTIGVACWLIGRFATLNAARSRYVTTWVIAVVVVVLGYWVFMETILDVRTVIAGVPSSSQPVVSADRKGIPWQPFSLSRLEADLKDKRTVFIDFTADWCLTCKVNEKTVMNDEKIVEKFKKHDMVAIRADWTKRNPDITRLLAKFGRSGVPLYVIFPAGRPSEPIVLPEVITTGIVLDAIDRAVSVRSAIIGS
jgi:thiol:disulfide interchange protein DsbD